MFNASSSKSNSSTRGTLHFTRQPRSCEVAPTLRQFHFQTSVSGIIVPDVLKMIVCQMNAISIRLMGISEQQKIVFVQFVPVFAYKYNKSSKIKQIDASQATKPPCWKDRPVTVQVEETRAVSAGPTQEFTKFRFWSSCLGDDLNVTRCPSSCFMKTLCLESTLHIMLSRPIWPCIRKKGWTAGILSMLQLTRSNHGGSWRRDFAPDSDFCRMGKESTARANWAFRSFLLD